VPWQTEQLRTAVHIVVPADLLPVILKPIEVTLDYIFAEGVNYVENQLPLELLTTRLDPWLFAAIRERLSSPEAIRLAGLLSHLLYWTVFGHLHAPSRQLQEHTQQSLLLSIQELWSRLVEPARARLGRRGELLARDSPAGMCFVLPVFLLALKRGVEDVFFKQYHKVFCDPDYGTMLSEQLVDQLNVLVMNVFDPDCAYANFGALDSSAQAIKLWRKLHVVQMKLGLTPAVRMQVKEFRTTPLVLLLMNGDGGGPNHPKTRQLMQKSSSDTVLATVAGVPSTKLVPVHTSPDSPSHLGPPREKVAPHLDATRRAVLYKTARNRLASAGMDQVSKKKIGKKSGSKASASTASLPALL